MKFLHTSDLHIGLRLCEVSMNEDIRHLLGEIVTIALDEDCDAVLISGDIYDRANPSPEAVAIFDEFVTELTRNKILVFGISGNHDSCARVAYLSEVLDSAGVYFSPEYNGESKKITLHDENGAVNFILLPFIRPSEIQRFSPNNEITGYTQAVEFQLKTAEADLRERNVVLAHHFVAGESEVYDGDEIGSSGRVDPSVFEGYDYTALGHLHMPAEVKCENGRIYYSGSPLRCSFSELGGEKSINIVTLGKKGKIEVERRTLHPLHELREIRGKYNEIVSLEYRKTVKNDDYIKIILTDSGDVPDAIMKLRIIYPNLMKLGYEVSGEDGWERMFAEGEEEEESMTPVRAFCELYELQNNESADGELLSMVTELFREIEEGRDETD